jgi:hypothetical protein
MATKRSEFTDRQKAEIFVLDKATCCMSGKNLWLLDYGAALSFRDWVDHIKPAAKGGGAELENGACMSWYHNHLKRDSDTLSNHYLFFRGRPTPNFFMLQGRISDELAANLKRFSKLHWSDWYFNRAVSHVLIAAGQSKAKRGDGEAFSRGPDYWAAAAVKCLDIWRKGSIEVPSLSKRGLVPKPISVDQKLLISLTEATSVRQVKAIIKELTPYVEESSEFATILGYKITKTDAKKLLATVRSNPYVAPQVKADLKYNLARLEFPESWDEDRF